MCNNKSNRSTESSQQSTGEIGSHTNVIGIAGAPPWFACQRCGAYRSTHAALRDLSCVPGRYEDVTPAARLTPGEQVQARVDQTVQEEDGTLVVFAKTMETGVSLRFDTSEFVVARGDVIEATIDAVTDRSVAASLENMVSTQDRVRSPTSMRTSSEIEES